jgi:2-oxoglutarate ferredoxin oxidoreductase subunit beta
MDNQIYDMGKIDIAWCPGCGNFGILNTMKKALAELEINPTELVLVSGIGQAAKIPHYFKTNFFNGLHGRALPPATAIKVSNPNLTVIAQSGDGDMYGEGGNHFIHCVRRNPNITNIVHNNMVYGLTKGQASPTSELGFKTPLQVAGVFLEPFNPLAVAIALDASFVT